MGPWLLGGPNVVTIYSADFCVDGCHEVCRTTGFVDWDLDGVDFYNPDVSIIYDWSGSRQDPGTSVTYAMAVIRRLQRLVGNTKTISYSTISNNVFDSSEYFFDPDTAIISAIHCYLNFTTLSTVEPLSQEMLRDINFLGIPMSKIGIMMSLSWEDLPSSESTSQIVGQVKSARL